MPKQTHRWVIDSIAEHVAVIEVDGDRTVRLPQWLLPRGVAEGQVLVVHHDVDAHGDRSALIIEIDHVATAEALRKSAAQVDALRKASARHDPGGDIEL
jgi:Protein of unknown function (DUF3006)